MAETREDGFLDNRLRIVQPARGYRAGADAVMLAAACPAGPGQTVLELGCGAGVASLCLGWRVPGLRITGLERQADHADLARHNATANNIALQVVTGDLARMPAMLRAESFDHVIANPPYFYGGTEAPDISRARARHEDTPLPLWIDAGLRRLRPGGCLTLIQRADRLDSILMALSDRTGGVAILPVTARPGRDAGRVIVTARKGARSPMRLLAPFVMHDLPCHQADCGDLSPAAQRVLRHGAAITCLFAKVP